MQITDETLDRLGAELKAMCKELCDKDFLNDDNRKAARDLAFTLQDFAYDRPTLAILADLLSRHMTRDSALAELVSA